MASLTPKALECNTPQKATFLKLCSKYHCGTAQTVHLYFWCNENHPEIKLQQCNNVLQKPTFLVDGWSNHRTNQSIAIVFNATNYPYFNTTH